jgi:hypothetical protein
LNYRCNLLVILLRYASGRLMVEMRAQRSELKGVFMLWKTLRWNWVNISAIAAFCLLPFIGLASGNFGDGKASAPVSLTQSHDDGVSIQTASFDAPAMTR